MSCAPSDQSAFSSRAQLAEVEPVRVDVVDVAELAGVGDRLELVDAGVVDEQVADHQDLAAALGRRDRPLGVLDRVGERLLDQAVLAGVEHPLGERAVRRDRRGEDDRVERVVGEQIVEVGGEARGLERRRPAGSRPARRRRSTRRARSPGSPRSCARGSGPSSRGRRRRRGSR